MSKAAEAPCPLLLLIWLRNFKCSKERRKQTALVGSRSNWCQSPFPTDLTLWQRRPQQSDGLWCRCGAWSWLCRRPSRSCWSCWPAVEPGPERQCHPHYHHHDIVISIHSTHCTIVTIMIIIVIIEEPEWKQRGQRRTHRLWPEPLNSAPTSFLFHLSGKL